MLVLETDSISMVSVICNGNIAIENRNVNMTVNIGTQVFKHYVTNISVVIGCSADEIITS
jgi:hypothetical protein